MKITSTDGKTQLATFVDGGTVNIYGSLVAEKIKLTEGANNGYILTSDSSGNATWSPPPAPSGITSITGTANEIFVETVNNNVTLSLPQPIAVSSSPTFNNILANEIGRAHV